MYSARGDRRHVYDIWLQYGLLCAWLAMIMGVGAARVNAQCLEHQRLTASDTVPGDLFASPISLSEDTAVISASWDECAAGIRFPSPIAASTGIACARPHALVGNVLGDDHE